MSAISVVLNFLLLTVVVKNQSSILYADSSRSSDIKEENTASENHNVSSVQIITSSAQSQPLADSYDKNVYLAKITQFSDIVIPYSADKDSSYINQTLFIGDSNTAGLASFGYMPLQNVLGKKSMGVQGVISDNFVWFKGYSQPVNIVKAVKLLKPRRIIINFGTNNATGITANEFKSMYKKALYAIEHSYPHCDIIVAAILPVGYHRENYNIKQQTIDSFNIVLAQLCSENGYHFLDYSEAFKDTDSGYMQKSCVSGDGVHLNDKGYRLLLEYINDHQLKAKDMRPDTDNIPVRINDPQITSELPETAAAGISDVPETKSNIDNIQRILDNNSNKAVTTDSEKLSAETDNTNVSDSCENDILSDSSSDLGNINSEKIIYDPFL